MGKKRQKLDPPKNLVYPDKKGRVNALRGDAICVIANKIDTFRRDHSSAGGHGKGAIVKKGYVWLVDRGPVFTKKT